MSQLRDDATISRYSADLLTRNDIINRWGNVVSSWKFLPGLVGFWPMSSVQRSTGLVYDVSGQGRNLSYNGNPTFNIYNSLVPYFDADGTGDFLSRGDESDLDIIGNETIYAASVRGLTMGGWFWIDNQSLASNYNLMGKGIPGAADIAYSLWLWSGSAATVNAWVSGATNCSTAIARTNGVWQFLVMRWIPSVSLTLWNGLNTAVSTSTVPATLNNTTGILSVMNVVDGRATLLFLSANAFPTPLVNAMYEQSRLLFNS